MEEDNDGTTVLTLDKIHEDKVDKEFKLDWRVNKELFNEEIPLATEVTIDRLSKVVELI